MLTSRIGEISALISAICFTITGICFESAGKKAGSLSVNFLSLIFGFLFMSIFTFFTREYTFPLDASRHNLIWLSISGVIGFFIGDLFLYKAYVEIGTRISLLIMAASPPLTALLGFVFLKESVSLLGLVGMFITIFGISLVILSKDSNEKGFKLNHSKKGLIYASLGALGQSVGTIFSKIGIEGYNAFGSTQIRVVAGFLSFLILFIYLNKWEDLKNAIRDKKVIGLIALGSIFGSFLGVATQLTSLQYTSAGIASTISAISPVIIIPFSIVIFKEKIRIREILGALIAVLGVAVLFLR